MNQKVLKKIVEELNKEKPDLSYLRGLAEALLVDDVPIIQNKIVKQDVIPPMPNLSNISLESITTQN